MLKAVVPTTIADKIIWSISRLNERVLLMDIFSVLDSYLNLVISLSKSKALPRMIAMLTHEMDVVTAARHAN